MASKPRPRLIRFDGADSDYWYWSTRSWTNPAATEDYTMSLDRRSGFWHCTCMDAVCRCKTDLVTAKEPRVCKHVRAVIQWQQQRIDALKAQEETN